MAHSIDRTLTEERDVEIPELGDLAEEARLWRVLVEKLVERREGPEPAAIVDPTPKPTRREDEEPLG